MKISHKALFHKLQDTTTINRCEQYARWTLSYLMADPVTIAASGRAVVERDFQSVGALLLNNLSAKLTQLLFPAQYPFFQAEVSKDFIKAAGRKGVSEEALRSGLARLEVQSNKRLLINSGYASLILALKYLIVVGNVLIYRDSKRGTLTTYGLRQFVTRRSHCGDIIDIVLREYTTVESLHEEIRSALKAGNPAKYGRDEQQVEKYTRIHREHRMDKCGYRVSQEIDTMAVGTDAWYPEELCPWMAPTWCLIPGEHYGRGMVEDYAGDFARLSALSEAAALYGVEIMKVVHLVGSGSGGDVDDLAQAESGEYVRGDPDQVKAHEAGDARKLEALAADTAGVFARLSRAFMYQGGTRQAERVTAYELQRDAQEAEYALGGVYSTLSGGIQVPLAHILMTEVSDLALPGLISGDLRPDVIAGIPALGRASDVQNLLMAGQEIAAAIPIAQLDKRIDPSRITDLVLKGRSVDPKSVFFTPEQQKANEEAHAAQQQANAAMLAGNTIADQGNQIAQTLGVKT